MTLASIRHFCFFWSLIHFILAMAYLKFSSAALLNSSSSSPSSSASTSSSLHSSLSRLSFSSAHFCSPCSLCFSFKLPAKAHLLSPLTRSTLPLIRASASNGSKEAVPPPRSVSVILLAGGRGKRMGASMPKQYLPLLGQPIALYSFNTFAKMKEVSEIIIVCDPSYRDIFEEAGKRDFGVELKFALPGKERQFSVLNGLKEISETAKLACVHDSARPLVLTKDIHKVMCDAYVHGAAVLGVPVKGTIKEAKLDNFVKRTLDRSLLWEMQTPQVIEPNLLRKGFDLMEQKNLEVTDDVSIVEHLGHPVFITEGSYTNIKVTTPDDMIVAERILHQIEEKSNS